MAWNGLGTYVLNPSYSPEVNGTTIDAARYNGLLTDVATGITQALNKNGENSPTTNINWGGFKLTNLGQPAAIGDALAWGKAGNLAGVVGSANYVMSQSLNTTAGFDSTNTSTGVSAAAGFRAFNDAGRLAQILSLGTNYAPSGVLLSGSGGLYGDHAAGMFVCAAVGPLTFAAGGNAEKMRLTTAGSLGLGITPLTRFHVASAASSAVQPSSIAELAGSFRLDGTIAGTAYDGITYQSGAGGGAGLVFTRGAGFDTSVQVYTNPNSTAVAGAMTKAMDINSIGDVTARGVSIARVKAAATARSSTATLAADPDLLVPLSVGYWGVKVTLYYSVGVSGGGDGFQYNFTNTGTITDDTQFSVGYDKTIASQGRLAFATGGSIAANTTGSINWLTIEGFCRVTVAGTLTFQWAQLVSGAHNLTLQIGSNMVCTKLA